MEHFSSVLLAATAALLLTWLMFRRRSRQAPPRGLHGVDAPDTVAGWPPEAARVMTIDERQALDLLKRAIPGSMVLAQVPLSRFVRVPTRRSYGEWLSRVGALSADLLLCDSGSRPLAVIDIRAHNETDRSRRRHERLGRVLRAAGVHVIVWREGQLPSAAEVRTTLMPLLGPVAAGIKPTSSRPMPLIPVAEVEELLAEGDARHGGDDPMEPVPSAFFDDALDAVRR
jgi:hypothetical protein